MAIVNNENLQISIKKHYFAWGLNLVSEVMHFIFHCVASQHRSIYFGAPVYERKRSAAIRREWRNEA